MRADLISVAFTTLYFGKIFFYCSLLLLCWTHTPTATFQKTFININQQNLNAGSCRKNKYRKINSLAQSYI